ncbi:hypothetical protein HID58_059882 [Brassica napus]|uniref:Uncharacterized protein n=1 Tax=Brassica napus TaxID=3708 RepID=A0ABQ7ZU71_BRANA|nr:hypothetical protein HID58_059882 [Brassica napus]
MAQVLAAPEEKRSGRGFDGKGGGFRSRIINNIRCELSKISPEHSTHPAGQVEDDLGTSLQRRVSSIAHVLAAPEEKRSGRGFDGKGGSFW